MAPSSPGAPAHQSVCAPNLPPSSPESVPYLLRTLPQIQHQPLPATSRNTTHHAPSRDPLLDTQQRIPMLDGPRALQDTNLSGPTRASLTRAQHPRPGVCLVEHRQQRRVGRDVQRAIAARQADIEGAVQVRRRRPHRSRSRSPSVSETNQRRESVTECRDMWRSRAAKILHAEVAEPGREPFHVSVERLIKGGCYITRASPHITPCRSQPQNPLLVRDGYEEYQRAGGRVDWGWRQDGLSASQGHFGRGLACQPG